MFQLQNGHADHTLYLVEGLDRVLAHRRTHVYQRVGILTARAVREVLDVDAYTGGYNLQIAFSCAVAAAADAAK